MAIDLSDWTPEQYADGLIQRFQNTSAIEAAAGRVEPMKTNSKFIPKDTDADVQVTQVGQTYGLDTQGVAKVQIHAAKITHSSQYEEEELSDAAAWVEATAQKKRNATSNMAVLFDNLCLGVTGAQVLDSVTAPYESVYHAVANYSSGANLKTLTVAATQKQIHDTFSTVLGIAEDSAWASEDLVWVLSTGFKSVLRGMDATGANGQNFYVPPLGGQPGEGTNGNAMRGVIAGYPAYFTRGARLSATGTAHPSVARGAQGTVGNAIAVLAPARLLIRGDRSPLESMFLDSKTGIGALSDTAYLKMRTRKGFLLGEASAAAVLELVA